MSEAGPITDATRIRHLRQALIAIKQCVGISTLQWKLAEDALRDDDIAADIQDEQSRDAIIAEAADR